MRRLGWLIPDTVDRFGVGRLGRGRPQGALLIPRRVGWLGVSTGANSCARRSCSTVKLETLTWRTGPSFLSSTKVDQPSSISSSGIWPVDLIQVDRVHAEPLKAPLHFLPDRVAPQALHRRSPRALGLSRLRKDVRALMEARERAANDLLGMPEAILRSGVDRVDAELERGGWPRSSRRRPARPAPVVASAADCPGAEAEAGDLSLIGFRYVARRRYRPSGVTAAASPSSTRFIQSAA